MSTADESTIALSRRSLAASAIALTLVTAPAGAASSAADESLAAAKRLAEVASPELDDWRLWSLAASRAAQGDPAAAGALLDELLALHPSSPLAPRTVVRRVELALQTGDRADARDRLVAARLERLPHSERTALERIAWQLAAETGDDALLAEAARQLLVLAPLEASKLKVVDVVASRRAAVADWRLWLSPDELLRRAEALLVVELPAGALTTLAAVPAERRGLDWRLLQARALTAADRGADAYGSLLGPFAVSAERRGELEWERAQAAIEAGTRRRGRHVADDMVERYRRLAREHLLAVVRHDARGSLAARALYHLADDYLDEEKLTEAVAALRQLAALRPDSTAGARRLWEHGWAAYERGDRGRAIEIWSDLADLYPRSASARSGKYWTARASEESGDPVAARQIYLELLAADTADFYARQAGLRLAGATRTIAAAPPDRRPWPESPRLARAERLSELGLDRLARDEIALVAAETDPRAVAALTARVLAQLGERRASLRALREAFPELGTAHQEGVPSEALALFYPVDYRPAVTVAATRERLSPSLVFGMIHQESAFDSAARSSSGARGLMQLMPSTGREVAKRLGLSFSTAGLNEPETSLRLGTHYFRQMLDRFGGNVELALAGYNGGPGRISRLWRAAGPEPELDRFLEGLTVTESRNYVKRILVLADSYRSLYPDLG